MEDLDNKAARLFEAQAGSGQKPERSYRLTEKTPAVADFLLADVKHNYAKSTGEIGIFPNKKDIVDCFISQDGFPFYVGNIDDRIVLDQVDVRIAVCDHECFIFLVVIDAADPDVG